MKTFGEKSIFCVEYNLSECPYSDEVGLQRDSWGTMYFWIYGKNVFRFRINALTETYRWNLCFIVNWFSERMGIIMRDEPFPLPVKGKDAIELMEKSEEFDCEDENEEEHWKWHTIRYEWNEQHGFLADRDGSLLPCMYFRRVGDKIEISWDNHELYTSQDVDFFYLRGTELIDAKVFEKVMLDFIRDFIKTFEKNYPKETKEYRTLLRKGGVKIA